MGHSKHACRMKRRGKNTNQFSVGSNGTAAYRSILRPEVRERLKSVTKRREVKP